MGNSRKKRTAKWVAMNKANKAGDLLAGAKGILRAAEAGDIKMWVTYCRTEKRNIGEATPDYNTAEANTEVHIQTTNPNHDAETIAYN
jgi:hypothetical protein